MKKSIIEKKREKLLKLVWKQIDHFGSLYFPDGPYGDDVYILYDFGFQGTKYIPGWVVPVYFSSDAYAKLKAYCNKEDISFYELDPDSEQLVQLFKEIDLRYGDHWELDPHVFIKMCLQDCVPDTLYHKQEDSDSYYNFKDFIEDGISVFFKIVEWDTLDEQNIDFWIGMLKNEN